MTEKARQQKPAVYDFDAIREAIPGVTLEQTMGDAAITEQEERMRFHRQGFGMPE